MNACSRNNCKNEANWEVLIDMADGLYLLPVCDEHKGNVEGV